MCNHCGYNAPDGAQNCSQCGAPLTQRVESGFSPRLGAVDQPEIPAWLESLRVGERPASPAADSANFSAADLMEEGVLPSWMRAQRGDTADPSLTGPHDSLRQASFSAPTTDGRDSAQQGIAAQSLVDAGALPSWMKSQQAPQPVEPQEQAIPDWMKTLPPPTFQIDAVSAPVPSFSAPSVSESQSPALPQSGQTAAEMPDWMKSLHTGPQLNQAPAAEPTREPLSGGFSPGSLIDDQSLPTWMKQGGQSEQLSSVNNSSVGSVASQPGMLSPGSLIDDQSLPTWMKQPEQSSSNVSGSMIHPAASISSQPGMLTPGSLIDVNALPSWMHEQGQSGGVPPSSLPPVSPGPSANPAYQGDQAPSFGQLAAPGSSISASSFIDMGSLPDWLKSAAGHYQEEQSQRPGESAVPPRVENVRVPSRPRREINPSESSEVAANVFASMLGVASASPQFPSVAQNAPHGQQQGQPGPLPPSPQGYNMSGSPSPQGYNMGGSPSPQGYNMSGSPSPQGYNMGGSPSPQGYNMSGSPSMLSGQMQPEANRQPSQGYGIPGSYGGYQGGMQQGMGQYPGGMAPQMPNMLENPGGKKRSLFDKFRDFFGFQK